MDVWCGVLLSSNITKFLFVLIFFLVEYAGVGRLGYQREKAFGDFLVPFCLYVSPMDA